MLWDLLACHDLPIKNLGHVCIHVCLLQPAVTVFSEQLLLTWIKVHILFLDAKIVLSVLSQCLWRLTNSICLAFSVSSTSHGEANLDTWSSQNHTSLGISSQWTPRISSLLSNFASQKTRKNHGSSSPQLGLLTAMLSFFLLGYKNYTPQKVSRSQGPPKPSISGSSFLVRLPNSDFPLFRGSRKPFFWKLSSVFSWCWNESTCFFHVGFGETSAKKTHDLFALENLSCSEFWKLKRLSFTPEVYFNFLGIRIFLGPIRWRDGHRRASGCGKNSESFSSPRSEVDKPSMIEGWMQEIHLGKKGHAKIPELSTEVVSTSWIRNKKSKLLVDLYLRFFPTSWF